MNSKGAVSRDRAPAGRTRGEQRDADWTIGLLVILCLAVLGVLGFFVVVALLFFVWAAS